MSLGRELEELGLSSYEARILLALLQLGSANSVELAKVSSVQRTSVYPVLQGLIAKGLAELLPGDGPATWTSPGCEEVFNRLDASLEERLKEQRGRSARAREVVARALADAPSPPLPYVHLIAGSGQARRAFEQLLASAEQEVLMFTRPPYSWSPGEPNPAVVDMLQRGVWTRVLYQSGSVYGPEAAGLRNEIQTYHRLGVRARTVDELPMKLLVVDRKIALLAMLGPFRGPGSYPTNLLIEDPGCAAVQAAAFEHLWSEGRPYGPQPARLS